MIFFKKIWQNTAKIENRKVNHVVTIAAILFILVGILLVYLELRSEEVDPVSIIGLVLIGLVVSFLFVIFLVNRRIVNVFDFAKRSRKRASKLRKRIVVAFSLGAALPTIIVAVFSTYFFNFGVQSWFDDKVSRVLEQSILVGESYIEEHVLQLKETAISISDDLEI